MKIMHAVSSERYIRADAINDLNYNGSSLKSIRGRDVIIVNPCCEGGGDYALAKKIANIALDEGCRVTIASIDVVEKRGNINSDGYQSYSLQHDVVHDISKLSNPVFIIAPLSIADINKLKNSLQEMCDKFNFHSQDALLIEEMDVLVTKRKELSHYELMLRDIGFSNVSANRLGFDEGSIGYIPIDEKTISEIKYRFEGELIRLLDSYNMSLSAESRYHLGYISSDCFGIGSQVYIANTLCETHDDEQNAIFIMSLRQASMKNMSIVTKAIINAISSQDNDMGIDYPSLFSRASISVVDSDDGCVKICEKVIGTGTKQVQIVLVKKMPKNIYDDFLLLADTGMMSGDQSLSDYLTLKGTLPYYDMQPWKYPLVESIKKLAGDELESHLDTKIVGRTPFVGDMMYSFITNKDQAVSSQGQLKQKKQLNKTLSSRTATPYIREFIRASLNNR